MSRISFEGFNNKCASFECTAATKVGSLVSVNSSGKIIPAVEGEPLFGICVSKRDTIATIQLGGYAEVPSDGSIADYGFVRAVYDSDGNLCEADSETEAPFVRVVGVFDETVGIIF